MKPALAALLGILTAQQGAGRKPFFDFKLKLTKALHDGGVGLLLGTDCMNPSGFTEAELKDRLEKLAASYARK